MEGTTLKNIDDKCIILHNSSENYLVGSLSIEDYNRLLKQISKNYAIEYVLVPVSKSSHVYIATHRELIPESFTPIDITYTVTVKRYGHPAEIGFPDSMLNLDRGNLLCSSFVMDKTYATRCNNFFEYQIFLFSMVKMMAYNILNNTSVYHPHDTLNQYGDEKYHYIFDIERISINRNARRILDMYGNTGIGAVLDKVQEAVAVKSAHANLHVLPCIYNFWIGYNGRCSYTSWRKPKQMEGVINKANGDCLISHACNNYNSYAFVSSKDEVLLGALAKGEMSVAIYSMMGDADSLVTDGPPTIRDLLINPEFVSVHKIETYQLYTVSDYVEALVFASDMLDMVKLVSDLIGDGYKDCQIMLEIRTSVTGSDKLVAYTVTKEQLDLGEIESVFDDFIKLLDPYLDHNLPF